MDCDRRCRFDHCHHHRCRLRELECRERESPGQISKPSEPLQDAWVAMRSDLESEVKPPCRVRIEERLKMTPEGAERLDRRSEVLNEGTCKGS